MTFFIYIIILMLNLTKPCFLVENFEKYSGQYVVYTNECKAINLNNVATVKNYNGQVLKTTINNYRRVLNGVNSISSETIIFEHVSLCEIKNNLNLQIKSVDYGCKDFTLYNAYTSKLKRNINSEYGKTNIQIAIYSSGEIYVGYPFLVDF